MLKRINSALLLTSMTGLLSTATTASAWTFYWSKVNVQTASWNSCMTIAHGVAAKRNLAGLRRDNLAVSGNANGASATITCIGTGGNSRAMAVVMVVGDVDTPVRQLRDQLAAALQRERIID